MNRDEVYALITWWITEGLKRHGSWWSVICQVQGYLPDGKHPATTRNEKLSAEETVDKRSEATS